MPIYEYACPSCRTIFSFLSRRLKPEGKPVCPKCRGRSMHKQLSAFSTPRAKSGAEESVAEGDAGMPDMDDPRVMRAMSNMERDMAHLDENNPKHMAQLMRKMQDIMPPGAMPKEMDQAIRRLEAGEDPEKIEQDMGEVFEQFMGDEEQGGGGGGYQRDGGLYDF